jgi:hypothetical protein
LSSIESGLELFSGIESSEPPSPDHSTSSDDLLMEAVPALADHHESGMGDHTGSVQDTVGDDLRRDPSELAVMSPDFGPQRS